ncbi:MAG TPA: alkaline phosphatase D family protein [Pseudomonadales bacterium]|nr:alkaline phosphatase D family protein [Pseudomonadales bacterium]
MTQRITRRALVRGMAAGALLPWWTGIGTAAAATSAAVFGHGVASGDPDRDSVVLWTRVTTASSATTVAWQVALDPAFTRIVRSGSTDTDAARDFAVKVLATDLSAGGRYYYRFVCEGVTSMVGRTRTLPAGAVDALGLAVVSCSNFPFGHFNAYDAIARDADVDLVLHLGDYLYEYAADSWGSDVGARIGRLHVPAGEIVSLDDYRTRHAQYRTDPASILMHAAHPLIAIWDDHESTNNPWTGGAQNHQPDTEGDWPSRRDSSVQAYYEWMPVREVPPGADRAARWRHFEFGDLASIIAVETRHTGRAEQIDYLDHLDAESSPEEVERFRAEVLGAPGRTMMAPRQEAFVGDALAASLAAGRPWRILANQVPMARIQVPPMTDPAFDAIREDAAHAAHGQLAGLTALGTHDLPIYLDTWDGYPWARERFYALCADAGVRDLLVLTGDSHAFWLNELRDDAGAAVGLELGTTGVTSPGDFADFGPALGARIDAQLAEHNPEVLWTDNVPRGYLRVDLTRTQAQARFIALSAVETTDYSLSVLREETIRPVDGRLDLD